MKIVIFGNGAWGSAVGSLLSENGVEFSFWQKGDVVPSGAIVVWAIPTQEIRLILEQDFKKEGDVILLNSAKGIEKQSHLLPYQIFTEYLRDGLEYMTLMGPSFAEEVKDKMPTLVNLGTEDQQKAMLVRNFFQTDYFRIRITNGINALELASAFKNVYAIACGIADGLGFGTNTRVKLMILAMEEFDRMRKKLKYDIDLNSLPATIGDLILTCSSEESRNYTFGKLLASYNSNESLHLIRETVEGYHTCESVSYFEEKTGVDLPLAHFVYDIVHLQDPASTRIKFNEFVKRT